MIRAVKQWVAGSALAQSFSRDPLPTELFAGVEKPTVTLAKMLVLEMLQNLDVKMTEHTERDEKFQRILVTSTRSFPSFKRVVEQRYVSGRLGYENRVLYYAGEKRLELDAQERQILDDGFTKFLELVKQRDDVKKESDRQTQAVDLIAALFKTEVKEDAVHKVPSGDGIEAPLRPH